jgi:hypothetical protein
MATAPQLDDEAIEDVIFLLQFKVTITNHFIKDGFTVNGRQKDNIGWDLDATSGSAKVGSQGTIRQRYLRRAHAQ